MRESYVAHILRSLGQQRQSLIEQWLQAEPIRHFVIDGVFPDDAVLELDACFPETRKMRLLSSLRERKYTAKEMNSFDARIRDAAFAFQDPAVIEIVSEITGIPGNVGDARFYAGGISSMEYGHYLNPHIDNSHDGSRKLYRTMNLLFYTSPNWEETFGGNLELWDSKVRSRTTVTSKGNRLVVMETNSRSWHSVSPLKVQRRRNCISNYYFSPNSPEGREYFNVTEFSARPEQPFRRCIMAVDGFLRNTIRRVIPAGLGRVDVNKE